jgi:hypothetical protein
VSPSTRRVVLGLAVVAVVVAIVPVAFVALGVWAWVSEPAHQLTLSGSRWAVTRLGDAPAPAGPYVIAFSEDANHATVVLSCGSVPLWWAWDTDGAALNLGVEDPPPSSCQSLSDPDRAVLEAVVSTEGWSVESDTRIHLDSTPPIELDRSGG